MLENLQCIKFTVGVIVYVFLLVVDINDVLALLGAYDFAMLKSFNQNVKLFNRFIYVYDLFILADLQMSHYVKKFVLGAHAVSNLQCLMCCIKALLFFSKGVVGFREPDVGLQYSVVEFTIL